MHHELDCRGLTCPAPVLQVKELLEKEPLLALSVIVDNEAAWENVSRFLEYQQFKIVTERQGGDFRLTATRETAPAQASAASLPSRKEMAGVSTKKILVMLTTDRMGHGDDGLGAGLLLNFLKTLKEMGPELWMLVFVNGGVTLTTDGAATVPILQELAASGVKILVCGTCLTHFNLLDKKRVGETTNMLDIVTAMQLADSVINL